MSTINTNGISVNYPVPGVNNNSQGFRDNFASIKTNLNTAGTEITDLQNKVIVKSALANTVINNDMANTLISNALTRAFRATTYNLGGSLSGTVVIDVSLGDVQYGTIAGDTTLQFTGWSDTGTQSNVELQFAVSNTAANLIFPSALSSDACLGVTTLENQANNGSADYVSVPNGVCQLDYRLSTTDCGANITIEPYNRPRRSTQIRQRTPAPTGFQGDVAGTVAVSPALTQLVITGANTDPYLTTSGATTQLYTDMPIVFTGVTLAANVVVGTTYYVRNVVSSTTFTVSSTIGGANIAIGANATGTTMHANPTSYVYLCSDTFNSTEYDKTVLNTNASGNVTLNNTTSLANNAPIIFSGTTFGGITADIPYYIKAVGTGGNITISHSRTNGVAGTAVVLTTASGSCNVAAYIGSDIWKRIPLTSW